MSNFMGVEGTACGHPWEDEAQQGCGQSPLSQDDDSQLSCACVVALFIFSQSHTPQDGVRGGKEGQL